MIVWVMIGRRTKQLLESWILRVLLTKVKRDEINLYLHVQCTAFLYSFGLEADDILFQYNMIFLGGEIILPRNVPSIPSKIRPVVDQTSIKKLSTVDLFFVYSDQTHLFQVVFCFIKKAVTPLGSVSCLFWKHPVEGLSSSSFRKSWPDPAQ